MQFFHVLRFRSRIIEGYEFARFEDIGKENPAFKDENGNQIKPDGQVNIFLMTREFLNAMKILQKDFKLQISQFGETM